jgi:hypothetical protein
MTSFLMANASVSLAFIDLYSTEDATRIRANKKRNPRLVRHKTSALSY